MTALEFAIKMELDGEQYYLEQAKKSQHSGLESVFKLLAQEEREHAELLEKYAGKSEYEFRNSQVYEKYQNVFSDVKDMRVEFKALPEHLDAYNLALEKEKESIELYEKMRDEASSTKEKDLFAFLVEQERIHYNTFSDIIEHVIKAKQWVESAEFGIREDY